MNRFRSFTIIGLALVATADLAAQSSSGSSVYQEGLLDSVTDQFGAATQTWYPTLKAYARYLLLLLAVLGLAWNAMQALLKKDDLMGFMRLMFIQLFTIGFYLVAIDNIDVWSAALVDTFREIATDILPSNNPLMVNGQLELSPSTIVSMGFDLWQELTSSTFSLSTKWVFFILAGLVTAILFAGMAAYLTLLLLEGLIVIAGGVVFLGFAGTDWTISTAKNYLFYCLSFAVKMFAVYLIMAIGITILQTSVFDPIEAYKAASLPPALYEAVLTNALFFAITVPLTILILSYGVPAIFQQIAGGMGSASNFALNSVLTTTLMTAASVGQQGLQKAGVIGLGAGMLGEGAHSSGMANVKGLGEGASFGDKVGAYFTGARSGAKSGMEAGLGEAWSGMKETMSGPARNEGSFVHGIANHFHPESFAPKGAGDAGGSASGSGG